MFRKLTVWQYRNFTSRGYLYIKVSNPYIKGVVGTDIKLTLWQRIKILFCGGVSVIFMQKREGVKNMSKNEILQQAILKYGKHSQIDVAIEEMSELTKALLKDRRMKLLIGTISYQMR